MVVQKPILMKFLFLRHLLIFVLIWGIFLVQSLPEMVAPGQEMIPHLLILERMLAPRLLISDLLLLTIQGLRNLELGRKIWVRSLN